MWYFKNVKEEDDGGDLILGNPHTGEEVTFDYGPNKVILFPNTPDSWHKITDRKPTICPRCNKKEVRKAVLGYPTEEDFYNDNIFLIGCIPDFPINRTWGCRQCDAAFFKDTPRNKAALCGLVPNQWPKD